MADGKLGMIRDSEYMKYLERLDFSQLDDVRSSWKATHDDVDLTDLDEP